MTYKQAKQKANKENPNIIYTGYAGNNCRFEVYFCPKRNRQIWTTITSQGFRVN
jgi:hypothetical protein